MTFKSLMILAFGLLGLVSTSFADIKTRTSKSPYYSAALKPGENFTHGLARFYAEIPASHTDHIRSGRSVLQNAESAAVPLSEIYARGMTAWDPADGVARFNFIRDAQFLIDPEVQSRVLRRSSWLYPDDGCFARAQLAVGNIARLGVSLPYKIFIFGNLKVDTRNSPAGNVTWWYHVVPAVRTNGDIYILDPAIEPRFPIRLVQWVDSMTTDRKSVKIAICSPYAYNPASDCGQAEPKDFDTALGDQMNYLKYERQNILDLGRIPDQELGFYPPWNQ